MTGDVVCNASPLIFLAKIKKLDLIDTYSLHIPSQVESEILKGSKREKEDAKLIVEYLKGKNISAVKVTIIKNLPDFLGIGEKAVISLAVREEIEKVFIDDQRQGLLPGLKVLSQRVYLAYYGIHIKLGGLIEKTLKRYRLN